MRLFSIVTFAVLVAAVPMTARAADPLVVPLSSDSAVPLTDTEFDWNGFYAGVYGVTQVSPAGGMQYGLGIDVGVNARFEYVLVGAEVAFHGLGGGAGSTSYLQALGRAGVAATDDVILYAAGGLGIDLGPAAETDALLGGGVELALTNDISLRGQYLYGAPLTGANPKEQVTVGANFHF
ncbi:MAG: porin family protein [Hyphomicrobiales bacterium]|nr:MAG: porin family protein [Hyphomicrobiales bacterium]